MLERLRPAIVVITATLFVTMGALNAAAEPTAGTKVADRSFAAVHLVVDTWKVTATVPNLVDNEAAFTALGEQLIRQVEAGLLVPDPEVMKQALVDAVETSPITYLQVGTSARTTEAEISAIGTGWTITPRWLPGHSSAGPEQVERRTCSRGTRECFE